MRGNSHVQFLGEGRSVMAVSYPTASLTPVLKKPRQRHAGGAFLCALCRSEQARSYRAAAFLGNFQFSRCCLKL